jgi:hypothetical protein
MESRRREVVKEIYAMMEQQHYEGQEPGTSGGRNHEQNEVAELLIDKANLIRFNRQAWR